MLVELVETMLKLHKDLPKAKTPHVRADGLRLTAYGLGLGRQRGRPIA